MATNKPVENGNIPPIEMRHRMAIALEHAGLTVTDMAETLYCSPNTVGNYLHGRTQPRQLVLQAWALRCGVPLEWIETGETDLGKEPRAAGAPLRRGKPKRPAKPARIGSHNSNHSYLQLLDSSDTEQDKDERKNKSFLLLTTAGGAKLS